MRTRIAAGYQRLKGAETAKAAWLAGAMIANNVIALIASVVFARLLSDYGALAALISYLIILTVAGQALQVATAREGILGHLGRGEDLLHTLERWWLSLGLFTIAATVASLLLRHPIAELVGVEHNRGGSWAAAAGIPAGCMYLEVSILRGALQSIEDYRSVGVSLIGEQTVRLIAGAILAAVGLGVAGAYLGSLMAYIAMSGYCAVRLYGRLAAPGHRRWGLGDAGRAALTLGRHVRHAWIPIAGLAIIQLLQNVDLIIAKHRMSNRVDSSYAVAAVAAKVLIWVAMGASFYLVPETSRRASNGEDTRVILARSLGIIAVCTVPVLLIFAVGAHPLLAAVFGAKRAVASSCLLPLGAAFTVLAATYLAVQYMLALKQTWFLIALAAVAALEPVLLLESSRQPASFAAVVLLVQGIGAVLAFGLALRPARRLVVGATAALALVIGVGLGLSLASGSTAEAADPPAISVAGNQLVANGQPVWLRGVNRNAYSSCNDTVYDPSDSDGAADAYDDADADGPVDPASVAAMTAWGINVVRLPISESCWLGEPTAPAAGQQTQPSDGETADDYRTQVENYVNRLGQNGLYVIVDLTSTAPPGYASAGVDTLPDEAEAPAFWTSVTSAFGSDPFVLFDLINEVAISQYDTTYTNDQIWNCWLNGCPDVPSIQDGVSYTSAGIQQLIDTVRATDATTPLIIGSPDYDFDKSEFTSHVPSDPANPSDPQLVYDSHLYDFADFGVDSSDDANPTTEASAVSSADQYISASIVPIAQRYPVMIGELGQQDCDDTSTGTAPFVDGVLSDLDTVASPTATGGEGLDLGVLGWTFDANADTGSALGTDWSCPTDDSGDGGPLLIRDFDGTPTVMGQVFKTWFLDHPGQTGVATTAPTTATTTSTTSTSSSPGSPATTTPTPLSTTTAPAQSTSATLARAGVRINPHVVLRGSRLVCTGATFTAPSGVKLTLTYLWYRLKLRRPLAGPLKTNSLSAATLHGDRVDCSVRASDAAGTVTATSRAILVPRLKHH